MRRARSTHKGTQAHRNRVAVQLARYLALHLVNVVVTLAWGTDANVVKTNSDSDPDLVPRSLDYR